MKQHGTPGVTGLAGVSTLAMQTKKKKKNEREDFSFAM